LSRLLNAAKTNLPLVAKITELSPTNHSIGNDMTLLQLASIRDRKNGKPSQVLIQQGAMVDLHSACGLGMTTRMRQLLTEHPESVSDQVDTYFPIQFAITAGRSEVIQLLVEHGDDVNRDLKKVAYFGWEDDVVEQNYTPWKPIHMASLWGFDSVRVKVAQVLATLGANLNALSPLDGFRSIHLAAMANRVEMIRFFVSQGVDIDSRTAQHSMIELLNEKGPLNGNDCTALMVAAAEGFLEATVCLLELGANPQVINDQGRTALQFAKQRFWDGQPYDKVIDLLENAIRQT